MGDGRGGDGAADWAGRWWEMAGGVGRSNGPFEMTETLTLTFGFELASGRRR